MTDKPQLWDYIGRRVTKIRRPEEPGAHEWDWAIELDGGVQFANKSRKDTFPPGDEIVGARLQSFSLSGYDSTIHLVALNGHIHKVGFNPTQYAIFDPKYGGQVFPQWPEELEERGISSHPDEPVSDKPSAEWPAEKQRIDQEQDARRARERTEFLEDTDGT